MCGVVDGGQHEVVDGSDLQLEKGWLVDGGCVCVRFNAWFVFG